MRQWTVESVLALPRGFMEARVVLTAAELDVFTVLSKSSMSLDEAVAALGMAPRGTAILLDALSAMDLLDKKEGRYSCPREVADLLSAESPSTVLPMMLHAAGFWRRWSQLTEIVRRGSVERPASVLDEKPGLDAFIHAMHVIGRRAADAIAGQAQADGALNLLDVGGATGTYTEAFLRRYPQMRATIFDRPPVIELARERLANTDIMGRIALAAGDFYTDELPAGHDLALLSAIIHQNSIEQNTALYGKVFRALVPGGRILIRDHIMNADRTQPAAGALFAVNMLAGTTGGNCYTFDEIRESVEGVGFTDVRLLQSGEKMDSLVEAFKP